MRFRRAAVPQRRPIEIPSRASGAPEGFACTANAPQSTRARASSTDLNAPRPVSRRARPKANRRGRGASPFTAPAPASVASAA